MKHGENADATYGSLHDHVVADRKKECRECDLPQDLHDADTEECPVGGGTFGYKMGDG